MNDDTPLKNAEAEKCAQDIAAVMEDKPARQAVFKSFYDAHPDLKNWEGQAIGTRALSIYRRASSQVRCAHCGAPWNGGNVIKTCQKNPSGAHKF